MVNKCAVFFLKTGALASMAFVLSACGGDTEPQDGGSSASGPNSAPANEVESAQEAQEEAARRREDMPAMAETGQRADAEIEQITWDYGPCTDAASLLPPPPDGWGLLNDTPLGEWPINAENARINYTYADETLEPNTAEYAAALQNLSIYISSGTPSTEALATSLAEPVLRDAQFEPGPYNYPVLRFGRSVLLGAYFVQLDGTGAELDETFSKIIRCGIEGGLIAEGVDPATLTISPL